ncbi:MAG: hypothetical protein N3G20_09515, partial [Verrucomicrobiae bacterium]|nr:hypothetical protein [Verrucomicrobiae bacterium]
MSSITQKAKRFVLMNLELRVRADVARFPALLVPRFWQGLTIPVFLAWLFHAGAIGQRGNPIVANVTPSSFSALWVSEPGSTPDIEVYTDPFGASNVTHLLRIEVFPLRTGAPVPTSDYERRASKARLAARSRNLGLQH